MNCQEFVYVLLTALITLHNPSGKEVYVNAEEIMVIRPHERATWSNGCNAEVIVHDREMCVREDPYEVKRLRDGD